MIVFKEEFIRRYIEKMKHVLEKELPDQDFFANMVDKADEIIHKATSTR